jgi:hypothetical protein
MAALEPIHSQWHTTDLIHKIMEICNRDNTNRGNLLTINQSKHQLDQSSDVNTELEEIRSLCKSLFPNPLGDTVIKKIELDIFSHKGKESRVDDYLQYLRQGEAFKVQMQKGIEKPVEKSPLSLHPDLYDLPQAAKDILGEIEQELISRNHPAMAWEEIKRLAQEFRITKDLGILNAALYSLKEKI